MNAVTAANPAAMPAPKGRILDPDFPLVSSSGGGGLLPKTLSKTFPKITPFDAFQRVVRVNCSADRIAVAALTATLHPSPFTLSLAEVPPPDTGPPAAKARGKKEKLVDRASDGMVESEVMFAVSQKTFAEVLASLFVNLASGWFGFPNALLFQIDK